MMMLLYPLSILLCYTINEIDAQATYFPIRNSKSGMAIDAPDCANETLLIARKYDGRDSQLFYYGSNRSIMSKKCNKALDIAGGNCMNGKTLILWPAHGKVNQVFVPQSDGSIINPTCKKVIHMNENDYEGKVLNMWTFNGNWNQKWDVRPKGSCREGRVLFEIDVNTGEHGEENSVSVRRLGRDGWSPRKSLYHHSFENNALKKLTHCLNPEKCYKITVKDRGDDGMKNGDGSYAIKIDGDTIKYSNFETGSKEETLYNC